MPVYGDVIAWGHVLGSAVQHSVLVVTKLPAWGEMCTLQ